MATVLLAGHETTSNALAWTFYLLSKHPEVRARLEHELDGVLGGRAPGLADLPRLPYTMQVFKEAIRLYPPAYMVVRRALRDVSIGASQLRSNDLAIVNIIGMHRRVSLFEAPLRFDPERFAPEREKALDRFSHLPFGGGPRVCIGNHFALMEGQLVLAHLAQHLRFELAPGHERIEPEPLLTLRPRSGLPVRIARRQPARDPRAEQDPRAEVA